jgi:hypothetical protein
MLELIQSLLALTAVRFIRALGVAPQPVRQRRQRRAREPGTRPDTTMDLHLPPRSNAMH